MPRFYVTPNKCETCEVVKKRLEEIRDRKHFSIVDKHIDEENAKKEVAIELLKEFEGK